MYTTTTMPQSQTSWTWLYESPLLHLSSIDGIIITNEDKYIQNNKIILIRILEVL